LFLTVDKELKLHSDQLFKAVKSKRIRTGRVSRTMDIRSAYKILVRKLYKIVVKDLKGRKVWSPSDRWKEKGCELESTA
jgi:hypothetical protein